MKKIEFVDFAKGFSILAIVIMHYFTKLDLPSILRMALDFGGSGIHLFFMISGFTLFVSSYENFFQFYKKRFLSIIVPYYIAVLLYFFSSLILPGQKTISFYELAGHFFLFKMFDSRIYFSVAFEFWFISTIIQFYILFPLLKRLYLRFGIYFVIFSFVLSLIYMLSLSYYPQMHNPVLQQLFIRYLWEFVAGFYLMDIFKRKGMEFWRVKPIYLLLILFVSSAIIVAGKIYENSLLVGIDDFFNCFAFVSFTILVYIFLSGMKSSFLFVSIGSYSFYLYLIHGITLSVTRKSLCSIVPFNIYTAFCLLIFTLVIAYWFKTIVSPLLNLKKNDAIFNIK
ncbi:MAG: acyltransferase [Crenarchaeota archaeon]|nr:acyltransferase [Thermoproteota archaeon]